jgi:adenosine deaminase
VLGSADALRRVAREAVEDAAADGCDYVEIRFGPATHRRPGFELPAVVAATCAGIAEGTAATGLPAGLIVAMLRHAEPETNLAVARAAAGAAGKGVVGLDIAGDELVYPSQAPYQDAFAIAAAAGLGLTAHAAEAGPPSSVVDAVELLGVSRIGHGSRVIDDRGTLTWAAERGIAFEVCPTSNVLTGAARSIRDHPMQAMLAAGCRVVLGDDDPITTGQRLGAEERLLVDEGLLTSAQLRGIQRTAAEVAFAEPSIRAAIRERFA